MTKEVLNLALEARRRTMEREALKLALEALEKIFRTQYHIETPPIESLEEKMRRIAYKALTAIKAALAKPEERNFCPRCGKRAADLTAIHTCTPPLPVQEPVAHAVIAGALFDFMGYLTSRKERVVLSASDDAAPAVDAIRDFAAKRGLSLDDAQVREWIDELAQPVQEPLSNC